MHVAHVAAPASTAARPRSRLRTSGAPASRTPRRNRARRRPTGASDAAVARRQSQPAAGSTGEPPTSWPSTPSRRHVDGGSGTRSRARERRQRWAAAWHAAYAPASATAVRARAGRRAALPSRLAWSRPRWVLPVTVFGSAGTAMTAPGSAWPPTASRALSRHRRSRSGAAAPGASTTQPTGTWPPTASGPPTTARSRAAPPAAAHAARSSSSTPTRTPATFRTSSRRPWNVKAPSWWARAPSPWTKRPPRKYAAYLSTSPRHVAHP